MTVIPKVGAYGTIWSFSHYGNKANLAPHLQQSYEHMIQKYGHIFEKIETGFTEEVPDEFEGLPLVQVRKNAFKYYLIYVFDQDKLVKLNKNLLE